MIRFNFVFVFIPLHTILKDNFPMLIILYIFIVLAAIQLAYYLGVFGKFAFAKAQKITPKRIPISVIVCAKNEEENVANYIPLLAEQNYPDFEIVLIDDASGDNTLEIFEQFEKQYPFCHLFYQHSQSSNNL